MRLETYQPDQIEKFAKKLQQKASSAVVTHTVLSSLLGLITAFFNFGMLSSVNISNSTDKVLIATIFVAVGTAIGGVIGFMIGTSKAELLRIQAAQVLCQLQTEINTRPKV